MGKDYEIRGKTRIMPCLKGCQPARTLKMRLKLLRKSARLINRGPRISMYAPPGKTRPCPLTAGAVADVVGSRPVFLTGCLFLACCFVLACGLARTGIELIMFRAMQGIDRFSNVIQKNDSKRKG